MVVKKTSVASAYSLRLPPGLHSASWLALSCPSVRSSRSCCCSRLPASSFPRAHPQSEGKQGCLARKTLLGRHACSYRGVFVPACQSEPWVSRSRVVPLDLLRLPSAMLLAPSGARRKASPQAQGASPFFSRCNGLSAEKALLSLSIIFLTLRETLASYIAFVARKRP